MHKLLPEYSININFISTKTPYRLTDENEKPNICYSNAKQSKDKEQYVSLTIFSQKQ